MIKKRLILISALILTLFAICWATTHSPWDGTVWDTTAPDILQPIGNHYKEMYDLRLGVQLRMNKGHQDMATSSVGGWHTWGSANCYTGTSDPCNRPDNSTSLDSTAVEGHELDWGRLWIDDNYDPPVLRRWNGTNFTEMVAAHLHHATAVELVLENSESLSTTDGTGDSKISAVGNKAAAGDCDLGYILFSHDGTGADQKGVIDFVVNTGAQDNAPTGQVLELGSDLLATFAGAVTVTGTLTASAAATVGTTLDVTGNIDPTTYETTNGGFLDEDAMGSDAADKVASQQSIKAYIDTQLAFSVTANDDSSSDAMVKDTVYLAATDGFITAYSTTEQKNVTLSILTDSANPPTVVIAKCSTSNATDTAEVAFVSGTIKNGEYFKVLNEDAAITVTIYWRSRGTLSKPVKQ